MEKRVNNLESLVQNAVNKHSEIPSAKVLKKLKFRLWVSDFFSLKPDKPNIVYAAIVAGAIIAGFLYFNNSESDKVYGQKQAVASESVETTTDVPPVNVEKEEILTEKSSERMLSAYFDVSLIKGCAPLKVEFDSRPVSSVQHSWDFGNGDHSTRQDPTYTYSQPGIYVAKLTVTNEDGQSAAYTKQIQVYNRPVAEGTIDVENSTGAGKTVQFINKSKGSSKYSWNFGDEHTAIAENPSHTYDQYGVYDIKLIATSDKGCSDTAEFENQFLKNDYHLNFPYTFKPNTTDKGNNGYYESNGAQSAVFYPKNYGVKEYHLIVRASNGMEVFATTNIKQGWNGYVRGRVAPGGVYSYIAKGVYPNGEVFQIEGKVKVIIEDYFQD